MRALIVAAFAMAVVLLPAHSSAQTEATCRSYLANSPSPAGIPSVPTQGVSQRSAFLADGGKLVAVGSRYYAVWFPPAFFTASTPVVVLDLPGTGGYPEAGWNDWHASMGTRGYAYIGLHWGGGTSGASSDELIYTQLKQIVEDVAVSCPIGNARRWLMGFSVGSAMSFAVMVRDVAGQRIFLGQIGVSGAAIGPLTTGMNVMHATVEAARSDPNAVLGVRSWLYCGQMDSDHGWSMCDEMPVGETFINTHGGSATLYRDPQGTHGSLPTSATAREQMFDYLVAGSPMSVALPVYRFFNNTAGGHFYTMDATEKDTVITNYNWFRYEGTGFTASPVAQTGTLPVYRFFNSNAGGHFYTISETEKNTVIQNYDWFRYEGIGFYAYATAQTGTRPVYRFFNNNAGGHFYTADETEKNTVIENYNWFRYEGIGLYVPQ